MKLSKFEVQWRKFSNKMDWLQCILNLRGEIRIKIEWCVFVTLVMMDKYVLWRGGWIWVYGRKKQRQGLVGVARVTSWCSES